MQINGNGRDVYVAAFSLICVSDVVSDIEAWVYLFARVENIFWVKDVLSYFKEFKHFLGIHEVEEWSTDDTVVVLTTDVALKLHCCFVESIGHFFYQGRCCFVGEVEERVEVEVAVATVTMDG